MESKRPTDTPFKQQRLPAWQPILSPPWVIAAFAIIAVIFVVLGVLILVSSSGVAEVEVQYDTEQAIPKYVENSTSSLIYISQNPGRTVYRWVSIKIPDEMKMRAPVYMYYKLENFYQNHRRYAKSRSDSQLQGSDVSLSSLDDCKPFRYQGEVMGVPSPPNDDPAQILAPCGLISWSMYNDSFEIYRGNNCSAASEKDVNCTLVCRTEHMEDIVWNGKNPNRGASECTSKGIAWSSDVDKKFKAPPAKFNHSTPGSPAYYYKEGPGMGIDSNGASKFYEGHVIPLQTDENFMVWMRTASLPTFRKLYRIFPKWDFQAGETIWIRVTDRFDVEAFGGTKSIVFSTTAWIGGKNYFLGGAYLVVGILCLLLAAVFLIKHLAGGRPIRAP